MNSLLRVLFSGLIFVLFAGGCVSEDDERTERDDVGTVRFVNLEGGFWGIVADSGEQFIPIDLPETYRRDGTRVIMEFVVRHDVASVYQWGTVIELATIEFEAA